MKDPTGICCTTSLFQSARSEQPGEKSDTSNAILKKISQYVIGHKWGLTAAAPKCSLEQIFFVCVELKLQITFSNADSIGQRTPPYMCVSSMSQVARILLGFFSLHSKVA